MGAMPKEPRRRRFILEQVSHLQMHLIVKPNCNNVNELDGSAEPTILDC